MTLFRKTGLEDDLAPNSWVAGTVVTKTYTYVIDHALGTGDVVEMAMLPAYAKIVDATLMVANVATNTMDVGFVSGELYANDGARTVGDTIFDGVDTTVTSEMPATAAHAQTRADHNRGIGFKVNSAIGAGAANKVVTLELRYAF